MKLRYRLFLWVALVFTIVFFASFYMEDRLTRINLEKTYQELMTKLDQLNDEKTKAIEAYLGDMLYKVQAEVDAVLQGVSKYPLVRKGFAPTPKNLENQNWLDSSSLMITNKWIDYVKSTNESVLMSEVIIDSNELSDTLHFPVHDQFHFIAIRSDHNREQWSTPLIGVVLDMGSLHGEENDLSNTADKYYVYFTPETIINFKVDIDLTRSLNLSINLLEPFLKWLELPQETFFLKGFLDRLLSVQAFLKKNPTILPTEEKWDQMIQKKLKNQKLSATQDFSFLEDPLLNQLSSEGSNYKENVLSYMLDYVEHYNKVGLIWGLSTLTRSNLFGRNPLASEAPVGMGIIDDKLMIGKGLKSSCVFFEDSEAKVTRSIKKFENLPVDYLSPHLDVITPSHVKHIFFGNTLRLQDGNRSGFLTVGTHGGPVLESLARSTHQMALFISGDQIITVSQPDGSHVGDKGWYEIPVESLLSKPSGLVTVGGKEYFFLHIIPYKEVDLHFFIFNPKEKEYAFINSVSEGSKEIIEKLSLQMRFAAIGGLLFVLIFLNNIAKRITKPISHLAGVTEEVAKGNLEGIEIPEGSKKETKDEIYSLYHSFFEMVKGLREKEKVKGVLNKVVSEEIAQEALKGNIQLGGEEKNVTVFFADIRGFTEMTEKMSPKEVIQFINQCMTKVSEKIDKHEGVIDKYVGDEVMALFGAPIEKKESAIHAIQSALEAIEELKRWNEERKQSGLPEITMGIGIHTGNVVAGNMGAENRLNYTVLGANVNLASRICSEAKGMQILISEETLHAEGVEGRFVCEKLQAVELKGFTGPVNIYEVKGTKG